MNEVKKMSLVCPKCGKHFQCKAPSTPGYYSVTCPNPTCKAKVSFNYPINSNSQQAESEPKIKLGLLDNGSYRFRCKNSECARFVLVPANNVEVGHNRTVCPKCQTVHEFDVEPTEDILLKCQTADCDGVLNKPNGCDDIHECICEKCGSRYNLLIQGGKVVKVTKCTEPPPPPPPLCPMKLVLGRFLGKKEYILTKGVHYIGRFDDKNISDFAIKDKYASSRSVRIDVNDNGGNLIYKLTVERASNPVYHNSHELIVDDVVYLTYGDTIKLGKTLIKVQKVRL